MRGRDLFDFDAAWGLFLAGGVLAAALFLPLWALFGGEPPTPLMVVLVSLPWLGVLASVALTITESRETSRSPSRSEATQRAESAEQSGGGTSPGPRRPLTRPERLSPEETLSTWMLEILESPLRDFEAGAALNPTSAHQHPEMAFLLDEEGVPVWWPWRHRSTREVISREDRRRWFLEWLAWELRPYHDELLDAGPRPRRRVIAESLLLTHEEGEWWNWPAPEWL